LSENIISVIQATVFMNLASYIQNLNAKLKNMKNAGLLIVILSVLLISASCTKEKGPLPDDKCNLDYIESVCPDCFFISDKDSVKWEPYYYGAEYRESDSSFLLFADKFGSYSTGNQILLLFKKAKNPVFNLHSNVRAEYNYVIGGDAGYFPYEWDSTCSDNILEITNLDTENGIIEGHFSIRLKKISIYTADPAFKEYIYLTNGSFKLCYYETGEPVSED
jgi:hypothetical protein